MLQYLMIVWWSILSLGTILDGEPIIKLPPKTIELKRLDFTMEERNSYNALEAEYKVVFAVSSFFEIAYWIHPSF